MKVNFLSDYIKFRKILGINGAMMAAKNQIDAMRKYVNISVNRGKMDCDLVHSHGSMPFTYRIMRKALNRDIPIIITAHQSNKDTDISFIFSEAIAEIVKQYIIRYYKLADLIICPTENSKRILRKELKVKQTIKVISNGIDSKKYQKSEEKREVFRKNFNITKPTILSVGFPTNRKGFWDFLRISKHLRDYTFLWVGRRVFPILQPNNIINKANVIMPGYVEDICAAYSGADIFCFPSYYEGEGLVVLEAMCCGLPVIIRDLPVYEGRFYDGKNCLKAKNNKEFIENIQFLLDNPHEKQKIIKNGFKTVQKFDIEKISFKIFNLYKKII
jgi:1,2-diacylglycerol-3-alpha-glucose alpha-1,2-glucosyltransferase